jgi:death on curing protein
VVGEPSDLVYPELEDVCAAFEEATEHAPGTAWTFVRSVEGILGTLGRPKYYAQYYGSDVVVQAAVLAHGIAETQPFIDGNKRTALVLLADFLRMNGFVLAAPDDHLEQWMLDVADHALTPSGLADRLRPFVVAV